MRHLDALFFLLLVGVAAVLRWLSQRGNTEKNDEPDAGRNAPPARSNTTSEEERVRRFLEALGQPAGSKPPAKVRPRPLLNVPAPVATKPQRRARRVVVPTLLPPLTTVPADVPTRPDARQEAALDSPVVEAPAVPAPRRAMTVQPQPSYPSQLDSISAFRERLRDPATVREAIILREILGPPRALQTGDHL